jgi:hypothetical protein
MAFPFGGHPRFNDYLEWARTEAECTYRSGFARLDGKVDTMVLIENAANNKHTIEFMPITEYLTPSMVSALDRRLGITSPFAKITGYDDPEV